MSVFSSFTGMITSAFRFVITSAKRVVNRAASMFDNLVSNQPAIAAAVSLAGLVGLYYWLIA